MRFSKVILPPGRLVNSSADLDRCIAHRVPAISRAIRDLSDADRLDVLVDATGALEYGAQLAWAAIAGRKPLVSLNAEVDATVGPLLDALGIDAGAGRSIAGGDQPAIQIELADFARSVGLIPRVLGNIKGLHDVRRTPDTQKSFAAQWGQNVAMVTSFADGTKVSFEQAIVANIMSFTVDETGMSGRPARKHVDELIHEYDVAGIRSRGGLVDYVVGAVPAPGVFCLAEAADLAQVEYLKLFKLGDGPLYSLYKPYHLCHLEVPDSIASLVGFGERIGGAMAPYVEVCAVAKSDLKKGAVLDGCGGFASYGIATTAADQFLGNLLPMGVAEGCVLVRDVSQDQRLTYGDVELPPGRLIDQLRAQQRARFSPPRTIDPDSVQGSTLEAN